MSATVCFISPVPGLPHAAPAVQRGRFQKTTHKLMALYILRYPVAAATAYPA